MALTADTDRNSTGILRLIVGDVAANVVIYRHAIVAKNAAGYIVPASDTAGLKVVGIATYKVDTTGLAAGVKKLEIATGVFEVTNGGGAIVQAGKHSLCYVVDDDAVTTAAVATNDVIVGIVEGFTATKVLVRIGPEYGALA